MIALVGTPRDNVLSIFSGFLSSQNEKFMFINLDEIAHSIWIYNDYLECQGQKIFFEEISGYYCRFTGFEDDIEDTLPLEFHQQAERLSFHCNYSFPNVINRPSSDGSNNSKPFQLRAVLENKLFKIPDSLVLANTVCPIFENEVIYKSTGGMRSIVTTVDADHVGHEITCPVLFQERLIGDNIRVHVIGDQVFALKIKSSEIDYRYVTHQPAFEVIQLPDSVRASCIEATRLFELAFSGIDLIQVKNDYFFLEANPTPGYVFFEEYMENRPISCALSNALKKQR